MPGVSFAERRFQELARFRLGVFALGVIGLCVLARAPSNGGHTWPDAHSNGGTAARILPVQSVRQAAPARGKILVAAEGLRDPNFAESVVLLIEHSETGSLGLILNRDTHVRLSKILPEVEELATREDTIFEGGPVERRKILVLLRASEAPEEAQAVAGDIYVTGNSELLKSLAGASDEKSRFRTFSGYAGWGPRQLEAEIGEGAWFVFPGNSRVVFDAEPDGLWQEFIRRTTLRLAGRSASPGIFAL